jgi:hypothetical protein
MNGETLLYAQYLRGVAEGNPKTTEELVSVKPATRYTLKSSI